MYIYLFLPFGGFAIFMLLDGTLLLGLGAETAFIITSAWGVIFKSISLLVLGSTIGIICFGLLIWLVVNCVSELLWYMDVDVA